jgi:hypothetical protein
MVAVKVQNLWKRKILINPDEEKKWGLFYKQYLSPLNMHWAKLQFESF